ncbi:unnamed protein product, partial [Mesorhabditis spiculigera]
MWRHFFLIKNTKMRELMLLLLISSRILSMVIPSGSEYFWEEGWEWPGRRDTLCGCCKSIVTFIQSKIAEDAIQLQKDAEKECEDLFVGFFIAPCKAIVDVFFNQIYQDLKKGMNPTQVCTELRYCGN